MTGELRSRTLPDTLRLAVAAGKGAGIVRISDVTGFAVRGIPVFQATRPSARSLAVSQGKGLTPTAAIVGALLEATELWTAEGLAEPVGKRPLSELADSDIAAWSGPRDELAIDLDPALPRAWVEGVDLLSGRACRIPWKLLSLDCTRDAEGCAPTSMGLASGNTRTEALVSGVAEVLEHHSMALFERLSPREKLSAQIALKSIDDPVICKLLGRIDAAGFRVKAWSLANEAGLPAVLCVLLNNERTFEGIAPAGGSGCHPSFRVAFLRALLEAVQSRAGLVAGARDDLKAEDYVDGSKRQVGIIFGALAFGDGQLDRRDAPTADCASSEQCLEFLLGKAQELTRLPVVAFDHEPPCPGLFVTHVVAPGLLVRERKQEPRKPPVAAAARRVADRVLFGGPSLAGLTIPDGIEVRPPARCGDLAALLEDPPAAVGLVDGVFKLAPTVWHKEIMSLLALGTRVIGGASLGAMRAAELERFGMEGVGTIFHWYRSGLMVRDDAVMLVHAPAELGYAACSLPLVDAEYALSRLDLPPRALRAMQRIVRRAPFETRCWRDCLAEYRARTGEEFPQPLEALEAAPSLKRLDARLVVDELAAELPAAQHWPMPPLTDDYRALLARTAPAFAASPG